MGLPPRSPFDLRDFIIFVGLAALFELFGSRIGMRGLGVVAVVVLVVLIGSKSGRIHPPSLMQAVVTAVLLTAVMLAEVTANG